VTANAYTNPWTPEKIETLKRMRIEGYSSSLLVM
jgi:hypothetical protein